MNRTYHSKEEAEFGIHVDDVSICEDELLFPLLLARKNDVDLLRSDRQNGQIYSIELIEAAPTARLSKTFFMEIKIMLRH